MSKPVGTTIIAGKLGRFGQFEDLVLVKRCPHKDSCTNVCVGCDRLSDRHNRHKAFSCSLSIKPKSLTVNSLCVNSLHKTPLSALVVTNISSHCDDASVLYIFVCDREKQGQVLGGETPSSGCQCGRWSLTVVRFLNQTKVNLSSMSRSHGGSNNRPAR